MILRRTITSALISVAMIPALHAQQPPGWNDPDEYIIEEDGQRTRRPDAERRRPGDQPRQQGERPEGQQPPQGRQRPEGQQERQRPDRPPEGERPAQGGQDRGPGGQRQERPAEGQNAPPQGEQRRPEGQRPPQEGQRPDRPPRDGQRPDRPPQADQRPDRPPQAGQRPERPRDFDGPPPRRGPGPDGPPPIRRPGPPPPPPMREAPTRDVIIRELERGPTIRIAPRDRVTIQEFKRRPDLRRAAPSIDIQAINFAFGSANIPNSQYDKVEQIARAMEVILRRNPGEVFLIEGHTDAVGSFAANQGLSEQRSASLAQVLVREFGIPRRAIDTVGYGEEFLLVQTDQEDWRNRRVTIRRASDFVR